MSSRDNVRIWLFYLAVRIVLTTSRGLEGCASRKIPCTSTPIESSSSGPVRYAGVLLPAAELTRDLQGTMAARTPWRRGESADSEDRGAGQFHHLDYPSVFEVLDALQHRGVDIATREAVDVLSRLTNDILYYEALWRASNPELNPPSENSEPPPGDYLEQMENALEEAHQARSAWISTLFRHLPAICINTVYRFAKDLRDGALSDKAILQSGQQGAGLAARRDFENKRYSAMTMLDKYGELVTAVKPPQVFDSHEAQEAVLRTVKRAWRQWFEKLYG